MLNNFQKGDVLEFIESRSDFFRLGQRVTVAAAQSGRVILVESYNNKAQPGMGMWESRFKLVHRPGHVLAPSVAERIRAFDPVPARKTDPATSHGTKPKRVSLRQRVLDAITEAGPNGATGHEVCGRGSDVLNSITPRFAELRKAGRIKDSGQRRDGQIVWVLA